MSKFFPLGSKETNLSSVKYMSGTFFETDRDYLLYNLTTPRFHWALLGRFSAMMLPLELIAAILNSSHGSTSHSMARFSSVPEAALASPLLFLMEADKSNAKLHRPD